MPPCGFLLPTPSRRHNLASAVAWNVHHATGCPLFHRHSWPFCSVLFPGHLISPHSAKCRAGVGGITSCRLGSPGHCQPIDATFGGRSQPVPFKFTDHINKIWVAIASMMIESARQQPISKLSNAVRRWWMTRLCGSRAIGNLPVSPLM